MKKRSLTIIMLLVGLLALDLIVSFGPPKDRVNKYIDESIILAAETYAICGIINGVVSTIKESSVSASPMGVGVEIEVGQVLDPVDDAVERISGLAATSLAVTGVQKIVFNIITEKITWPFIIFTIFTLAIYLAFPDIKLNQILLKVFFVILFVRLSIPLMSGVGVWVDDNYIQEGIDKNIQALKEFIPDSTKINFASVLEEEKEEPGFFGRVMDYVDLAKTKVLDYYAVLKEMTKNVFSILSHFKEIIVLLAAKVIMQVLLIPLGALWVMRRLFAMVFETDFFTDKLLS